MRLATFLRCCLLVSVVAWPVMAGESHKLVPTPKNVAWGWFDPQAPPVLRVRSGDTVDIEALAAGGSDVLEASGLPRDQIQPAIQKYDLVAKTYLMRGDNERATEILQEALKSGFDKRPDVQAAVEAAKDSALFDQYIKDVVAPNVVTNAEVRKYYDEHEAEFGLPESAKVRHIVITWNNKPKPDALEKVKTVATEIRSGAPSPRDATPEMKQILLNRFAAAARRVSEDGSATSGGDLGWVTRGSLDRSFEDAAFALKPMTMSGIVESQFGYHLIFVEDKKPPRTQSFDEAKADIREFLMTQHAADVMGSVKRLTNELRANSKIAFYPENLN